MSCCNAKNPFLFLGLLAIAVAVGGMMAGQRLMSVAAAEEKEAKMGQLKHVVLLKFKDGTSDAQVKEVMDAFVGMKNKIDAIAGFEWGTDVSVENLSQGFTHCAVVTFKDTKARDEYLPHPAHEEFKKLAVPRIDKVLVVDYYVQE